MKKIFCVICIGLMLAGCGSRESVSQSSQSPSGAASNQTRDFVAQGQALLVKGDIQGAINTFKEGIVQDPNNFKLHFVLGQMYMRAGAYNNAEASFKSVVRIDPENGNAYLLLGGCYDLLGKKAEAIESIKKSVELFQKQRDTANFRTSVAF